MHLAKNLKKINNREKEGGGEEGGKANPPTPIHTNAEKWYKIMVDSTSGQGLNNNKNIYTQEPMVPLIYLVNFLIRRNKIDFGQIFLFILFFPGTRGNLCRVNFVRNLFYFF